jgi:hypothetical protein
MQALAPVGSNYVTAFTGTYSTAGTTNSDLVGSRFGDVGGMVFNAAGDAFVADSSNNQIRKISSTGMVSLFAGSVTAGKLDGTGTLASFSYPSDITMDSSGNLFVVSITLLSDVD